MLLVVLLIAAPMAVHAADYTQDQIDDYRRDQRQLHEQYEAQINFSSAQSAVQDSREVGLFWIIGMIACGFVLFGAAVYRRRHDFGVFARPAMASANVAAVTTALGPQASLDKLAGQVNGALRFGSFRHFLNLFPTRRESRRLFDEAGDKAYWSGPRSENALRPRFESVRRTLVDQRLRPTRLSLGELVAQATTDGSQVFVAPAKLVCEDPDGERRELPLGSVMELDGTWRMLK